MSRGTKVRSSCWLQQSENALQYLDGPTSLRLARPFGIRVVDGFQFFDWAGLRSLVSSTIPIRFTLLCSTAQRRREKGVGAPSSTDDWPRLSAVHFTRLFPISVSTGATKRRAAPPATVYLTIACSVRRFEVSLSFSTSLVFFFSSIYVPGLISP